MAQPPLSQRIKDLERELGLQLFHRSRAGTELTEAGALLLEHAREVLHTHAVAVEAMRRIRPGTSGILEAAIPPDTNPHTVQTLVEDFAHRAPDVSLRLHELTTDEQLCRLRDGVLDVAVVRHPLSTVGIETGRQHSAPLGVMMHDAHPLATKDTVSLRDLNGSALVIFPRIMAPTLYDSFLQICRDESYLPPAVVHARNPNFTQGLLLLSKGIHFNVCPWAALPKGICWKPLDNEPLAWRTSAAWLKSRKSTTTSLFVESVDHAFADES